ncbi:MAG: protein-L-isoaspartate(D-aspartate) O-methyltransferase [Acidobacteria bacterium]|nr:protein-L-isoaspartate(D-aspartate) O-methyltransferase [Acidobacteriota bacterium]
MNPKSNARVFDAGRQCVRNSFSDQEKSCSDVSSRACTAFPLRRANLLSRFFALLLPSLIASFPSRSAQREQDFEAARTRMVDQQLRARGIQDDRVLQIMRDVPRHLFVPEEQKAYAYEDKPLPIGFQQTISQPYIVALMTELLAPGPNDTVLEIGTGSGYQAAVLARVAKQVYSIEIVPALASQAAARLQQLGFANVSVIAGDGYKGWPEHAPFDHIIVTAAPPEIPPALIEQLKRGGRMVVPVGKQSKTQNLLVLEKSTTSDHIVGRKVIPVRFVPMVSEPAGKT